MKEDLIKIGFTECIYPKGKSGNWLKFESKSLDIDFCPDDNGFFWLKTKNSGDSDMTFYPYKGIEKLQALMKANEEYFTQ